mmetsp:Transcript_37390/g.102720  ORF Transcript_37390/g.102720 Transcript_37390/m.102720 type:complete len:417 (-) Transcript_37390:1380-2630(-)
MDHVILTAGAIGALELIEDRVCGLNGDYGGDLLSFVQVAGILAQTGAAIPLETACPTSSPGAAEPERRTPLPGGTLVLTVLYRGLIPDVVPGLGRTPRRLRLDLVKVVTSGLAALGLVRQVVLANRAHAEHAAPRLGHVTAVVDNWDSEALRADDVERGVVPTALPSQVALAHARQIEPGDVRHPLAALVDHRLLRDDLRLRRGPSRPCPSRRDHDRHVLVEGPLVVIHRPSARDVFRVERHDRPVTAHSDLRGSPGAGARSQLLPGSRDLDHGALQLGLKRVLGKRRVPALPKLYFFQAAGVAGDDDLAGPILKVTPRREIDLRDHVISVHNQPYVSSTARRARGCAELGLRVLVVGVRARAIRLRHCGRVAALDSAVYADDCSTHRGGRLRVAAGVPERRPLAPWRLEIGGVGD